MNGIGISRKSSKWPLKANVRRHSGDVTSSMELFPLYTGVTRIWPKCICNRLSRIHKHFSINDDIDIIVSIAIRKICIRLKVGKSLSSNSVGK